MSTALDFPTTHREHTKHAEYREHRAHPSRAWTTESATTLLPADTLLGPSVRNTVSGRTRIWKGRFERVHRQSSSMHARMDIFGSRYPPIHHHLHKQTNKDRTSRALSSKSAKTLPLCCMLIHSLIILLFLSLFLFFTYFCPATANLVIGCLVGLFLAFAFALLFLFLSELGYNERRSRSYDDESMGIRR